MNILFVTFGELSVGGGAIRSISVLRALADAGHQVDVIAAKVGVGAHPHINALLGGTDRLVPRKRLKIEVLRALGRKTYHVMHAVDDAIVYIARVRRWRRIPMVYEAARCFTGPNGQAPSWQWKFFADRFKRLEQKLLTRSAIVLSSCDALSSDIRNMAPDAHVVQIEDIPAHPLFPRRDADRAGLLRRFDGRTSAIVVCSILPGNRGDLRKLLVAVRKVVDVVPTAGFFLKGVLAEDAESMAASLDIKGRCAFIPADDPECFLAALTIADVALFVPEPGNRYMSPEILTMLQSPAPVVAVQAGAYAALLTERTSVQVVSSSESMAEGLLRIIQEPLLSIGIATEAQQLIADRFSFSSFKHKIRMAYHELM